MRDVGGTKRQSNFLCADNFKLHYFHCTCSRYFIAGYENVVSAEVTDVQRTSEYTGESTSNIPVSTVPETGQTPAAPEHPKSSESVLNSEGPVVEGMKSTRRTSGHVDASVREVSSCRSTADQISGVSEDERTKDKTELDAPHDEPPADVDRDEDKQTEMGFSAELGDQGGHERVSVGEGNATADTAHKQSSAIATEEYGNGGTQRLRRTKPVSGERESQPQQRKQTNKQGKRTTRVKSDGNQHVGRQNQPRTKLPRVQRKPKRFHTAAKNVVKESASVPEETAVLSSQRRTEQVEDTCTTIDVEEAHERSSFVEAGLASETPEHGSATKDSGRTGREKQNRTNNLLDDETRCDTAPGECVPVGSPLCVG